MSGLVELAPGETDSMAVQVDSKVLADLRFQIVITYRVANELATHTLTLRHAFEVVFSDLSNWPRARSIDPEFSSLVAPTPETLQRDANSGSNAGEQQQVRRGRNSRALAHGRLVTLGKRPWPLALRAQPHRTELGWVVVVGGLGPCTAGARWVQSSGPPGHSGAAALHAGRSGL